MRLVAAEAIGEIGGEIEEERLERFIASYVATYANRHAVRHESAIRQLMLDNAAEDELLTAIEAKAEQWRQESAAQSIGNEESVRAGNAATQFAYILAGVTLIRWRAFGESCPYCTALNGRVVGINETFLAAGESFQPEEAEEPLQVTVNIGHPPAHRGCDCMLMQG